MSVLNLLMILAIGAASLIALFHLQRLIFFLWFKFSTRDRGIITVIVMNQLARNKTIFSVPEELVKFIYELLENQEHGVKASEHLFNDMLKSVKEFVDEFEADLEKSLTKEKPNDN